MNIKIRFKDETHLDIPVENKEEGSALLRSINGAMATGMGIFLVDGVVTFRGEDVLYAKLEDA